MNLDFNDAAPIKRPFTGGKQAEPNPYTDVIKAIALKTYPKEHKHAGEPIAKTHVVTHADEETMNKDRAKIGRQVRAAANKNEPSVTGRVEFTDEHDTVQSGANKGKVKTYKTRVTFWTVNKYAGKNGKKDDTKTVQDDAQTNDNVTTDVTKDETADV